MRSTLVHLDNEGDISDAESDTLDVPFSGRKAVLKNSENVVYTFYKFLYETVSPLKHTS